MTRTSWGRAPVDHYPQEVVKGVFRRIERQHLGPLLREEQGFAGHVGRRGVAGDRVAFDAAKLFHRPVEDPLDGDHGVVPCIGVGGLGGVALREPHIDLGRQQVADPQGRRLKALAEALQ